MSHVSELNIGKRLEIARFVAPAFTHKYDFSEQKHFDEWAIVAFKAADALVTLADQKQAAAEGKDEAIALVEAQAAEAKRLKEQSIERDRLARASTPPAPV